MKKKFFLYLSRFFWLVYELNRHKIDRRKTNLITYLWEPCKDNEMLPDSQAVEAYMPFSVKKEV